MGVMSLGSTHIRNESSWTGRPFPRYAGMVYPIAEFNHAGKGPTVKWEKSPQERGPSVHLHHMTDYGEDTTNQQSDSGGPSDSAADLDQTAHLHWWEGSSSVLEAPLPHELQTALGDFLGRNTVETLGDWSTAIRELTGGGPIEVDTLCHASEETPHWGDIGGERHYFECFYDAVILAALNEQPVDIHTISPQGSEIEARAVGSDSLTVSPRTAVFSFGIDQAVREQPDQEPTITEGYAAICPYVKAFPSAAAYTRWAGSVSATTVALPLEGATEIARGLLD